MSRKTIMITLVLVFLMTSLGFGAQGQDNPLIEQTILLTFVPNIQFSPVYVTIEKGYFAEAGIQISDIEYLDEPDIANLVAENRYRFGVISGEQVIMARSAQRDLVFVYEWFQQFPVGIVTPVNTGIESVADLVGHKVGVPGRFGASYSGLSALLSANGLTEDDIQLETIGFTAPETVCVGYETDYAQGVEASVVYISNEPFQIEQNCTEVRVFPVAEAVDMVSNGLVTNAETIANDPALVQAMVSAYDRGLRDVINNPAEAYLLSAAYVESLPLEDDLKAALEIAASEQAAFLATEPDREAIAESRIALWDNLTAQFDMERLVNLRVLLDSIALWDADIPGLTDPDSWEVTQSVLEQLEFLSSPLTDLSAAYTNDFVASDWRPGRELSGVGTTGDAQPDCSL